jgi:hypothetical protein
VPQGLAVAEAALDAGVTILGLGTPLLKYEGVRNVRLIPGDNTDLRLLRQPGFSGAYSDEAARV